MGINHHRGMGYRATDLEIHQIKGLQLRQGDRCPLCLKSSEKTIGVPAVPVGLIDLAITILNFDAVFLVKKPNQTNAIQSFHGPATMKIWYTGKLLDKLIDSLLIQ